MLKINYCRDGIAISDYEVEKFVDDTIKVGLIGLFKQK